MTELEYSARTGTISDQPIAAQIWGQKYQYKTNDIALDVTIEDTWARVGGVCQTSCPVNSCSVSNFRVAYFVLWVKPYWSSRLPIPGFS